MAAELYNRVLILLQTDMKSKTPAEVRTYFAEIPMTVRENIPSDRLEESMPADTAMQLLDLFVDTGYVDSNVTERLTTMDSLSPLQLKIYTMVRQTDINRWISTSNIYNNNNKKFICIAPYI